MFFWPLKERIPDRAARCTTTRKLRYPTGGLTGPRINSWRCRAWLNTILGAEWKRSLHSVFPLLAEADIARFAPRGPLLARSRRLIRGCRRPLLNEELTCMPHCFEVS